MTKSKSHKKSRKSSLKKFPLLAIISPFIVLALVIAGVFFFKNLVAPSYIVETDPFFAPFEFYEGTKIKGIDIDITNRAAEKLGQNIAVKSADFSVIIDNVSAGKVADAGASSFTITPARAAKVNFTIPYYSSVQYVIYDKNHPVNTNANYINLNDIKGKTIAVETDTTGWIFIDDEIKNGALINTGTTLKSYDSAQLAADGIFANLNDLAIADSLSAKYIVSKNSNLACLPLYYLNNGVDAPVQESYAIAVNKNRPELLEAFNAAITEMLANGEIDQLIKQYTGFSND